MEAWAHALDSQLVQNDSDEASALARTKDLLHVMAQQAVKDVQTPSQSALDSLACRQLEVEKALESCQSSIAALQEQSLHPELGEQVVSDEKFTKLVRAVAGTTQKLIRLEHNLTILATSRSRDPSSATTSLPSTPEPTGAAVQQQIMQLLQAHTRAISQTWQWVSANVRVTQQHATWIGNAASRDVRVNSATRPTSP
eukprot:6357947-Amphidinium_carterae.5